ncbi:MAG: hypothetical protein RLZZ09_482 [Pseudomonadota bacterium]|jgi:O-antigen ligase
MSETTRMLREEPLPDTAVKTAVHKKPLIRRSTLPRLVWVAFGATLAASFIPGDLTVFGLRFSGLAWAVSLLISLVIITQRMPLWRFPVYIWLPWILLLLGNLPESLTLPLDYRVSPVQRTCQLLAPIFVGIAISTYRIPLRQLRRFVGRFRQFLVAVWFLSVLTNLDAILTLSPTGLASQAMTAMLGCIFFICRYYMFRDWRDLGMYAFMATMPVFAITRMVIANTLLLPVMMLVPIPLFKRMTFLGLSMMAGVFVFFLPQVQRKMFFSGHGEFADVSLDNKEFATSGRSYIWENLLEFANKKPWFGHGTGQGETFTYSITPVGYPHNDWLLTYADYGLVGVGVYLICNLWTLWDLWRHGHKAKHPTLKLFFFVGASSFIPYMTVMFSDNIMVYAPFFGILQYTIIGLAYGALNTRKRRPKRKRKSAPLGVKSPVSSGEEVGVSSPG